MRFRDPHAPTIEVHEFDPDRDRWLDQFRKMQSKYDTRQEKSRRPSMALAVAAILLVAGIAFGLYEYWQFFTEHAGSKYD